MAYRLGLIGYPIKHSLSPWIHQNLLQKAGLSGTYELYEMNPRESFSDHIKQLKEQKLDGFNITVPYKQKIMPYLDVIDKEAEAIGAVNTVVNQNGKWTGYNTDGVGYLRSLVEAYPEVGQDKKERFLVIGAGGAARAIIYTLFINGFATIDIANRTEKSGHLLKSEYALDLTTVLSLPDAEQVVENYDVIIQTTSVGMKSTASDAIVSLKSVAEKSIVSDIVYQPLTTSFLQEARTSGARIHYGHTMLLYQAQYAFELWTGNRVEIKEMNQALVNQLEG